jgi:hypothetical protein
VQSHKDRSGKIREIGAALSILYSERGKYRAKPTWKASNIAGQARWQKSEKGKASQKN